MSLQADGFTLAPQTIPLYEAFIFTQVGNMINSLLPPALPPSLPPSQPPSLPPPVGFPPLATPGRQGTLNGTLGSSFNLPDAYSTPVSGGLPPIQPKSGVSSHACLLWCFILLFKTLMFCIVLAMFCSQG